MVKKLGQGSLLSEAMSLTNLFVSFIVVSCTLTSSYVFGTHVTGTNTMLVGSHCLVDHTSVGLTQAHPQVFTIAHVDFVQYTCVHKPFFFPQALEPL